MTENFPALDGPGSCDQPPIKSLILLVIVYVKIAENAIEFYGN